MAHTFKNIVVWQKAHLLVLEIYKVTRATNIVEGYKIRSDKDFAHFLNMADGSLEETKYHLLLSYDLKYMDKCNDERLSNLSDEVRRMLFGFQKKLTA